MAETMDAPPADRLGLRDWRALFGVHEDLCRDGGDPGLDALLDRLAGALARRLGWRDASVDAEAAGSGDSGDADGGDGGPHVVVEDGGEALTIVVPLDAGTVVTVHVPFSSRRTAGDREVAIARCLGQLVLPLVRPRAAGRGRGGPPPGDLTHDAWPPLTGRERETAELVARGLTNREIAERLAVSIDTVKKHVTHALTKTAVDNRTQLALLWAQPSGPA